MIPGNKAKISTKRLFTAATRHLTTATVKPNEHLWRLSLETRREHKCENRYLGFTHLYAKWSLLSLSNGCVEVWKKGADETFYFSHFIHLILFGVPANHRFYQESFFLQVASIWENAIFYINAQCLHFFSMPNTINALKEKMSVEKVGHWKSISNTGVPETKTGRPV